MLTSIAIILTGIALKNNPILVLGVIATIMNCGVLLFKILAAIVKAYRKYNAQEL